MTEENKKIDKIKENAGKIKTAFDRKIEEIGLVTIILILIWIEELLRLFSEQLVNPLPVNLFNSMIIRSFRLIVWTGIVNFIKKKFSNIIRIEDEK